MSPRGPTPLMRSRTAAVERLLTSRPRCIKDLSLEMDLSFQTVCTLVGRMRAEMHVDHWTRGTFGPAVPHYFWGEGKDAPLPPRLGKKRIKTKKTPPISSGAVRPVRDALTVGLYGEAR